MATILSNKYGQVIKSSDVYGDYYYLADDFGTPTVGAWSKEEDALAAFEALETVDIGNISGDLEMDEQGYRLVECAYCGRWVRPGEANTPTPPAGDDEAWSELAKDHADGCEWVETRSHKRDLP